MLEDFLKDIYDKAISLELLKEASHYSYIRQPYKCREIWNDAIIPLSRIIDDIAKTDKKNGKDLLDAVQKTIKDFNDRSEFGSEIDCEIIPRVAEYLDQLNKINVEDGQWTLLSSKTGFLTLRDKNGLYLHSRFDPMWEGFTYAMDVYDPYVTRYNILGCGLGYLAYQLWRISDGEADIYVYEVNDVVREYSYLFGVMSLIDKEHIHVIGNENKDLVIEGFFEEIPDEKIVRTIYYWDKDYYTGSYSGYIEIARSSEFTSRVFDSRWKRNYLFNISLPHCSVSEFDRKRLKEEWVIVAAGPSLNDNEYFIAESVGKRTVCAINTTLKWFCLNSIIPDVCFACDPNNSLIPYIEEYGEFSRNIPLIADYVTNHRYVELYQGERYFTVTATSVAVVDKDLVGNEVWSFGGTVTSMAIEAAYRMGAKKIYLVGADLSYPGRITYADGVGADPAQWNADQAMVVSVDDALVPTSKVFSEYISQIEDQISAHPDCQVINRSSHGAYFKGSYCGKWWENLPDGIITEDYIDCFTELKKQSLILGWKEKYYVFWQIYSRMISKTIIPEDTEKTVINDAYRSIYSDFEKEFDWLPQREGMTKENLIYIFTNEYWDESDEQTGKVLQLAEYEIQQGKKVLIINTSEKFGGKKVPIYNALPIQYNTDLENAEMIDHDGRRFLYFQLSKGMPDLDHYKVFLDSMFLNKPVKIYIASKYSLLADYCASKFDVDVKLD